MKKRNLAAEDIFQISLVGDVALHPNNQKIAYVVTQLNSQTNAYDAHIWITQGTGAETFQFTHSQGRDTAPEWSPCGKWLAFISDRSGTKQLFVMPESGGEARQLTQLPTGVQMFRWDPTGKRIAFTSNVSEWQDAPVEPENARNRYTQDVKIITRSWYRQNGVGYFSNRRNHLFVVSLTSPRVCQRLTQGAFDIHSFDFAPSGQEIVIASNVELDADDTQERYLYTFSVGSNDLAERSIEASELSRLSHTPRFATMPKYSPNGQQIAFYGHNFEQGTYTQNAIYLLDVQDKTARCLTAVTDEAFGDLSVSDTRAESHPGLQWSEHGRYVYSLMSTRGNVQMVRIHVQDGHMERLSHGDHAITTYALDRQTSMAAVVRATTTDPANVFLHDIPVVQDELTAGRQITHWNESFRDEVDLVVPQKFQFENESVLIDGWIMLPNSPAPETGYPTVVEVHGGPMMMYANDFFFEFQLLAASGIAVVFTNPHGSMGYGQAFCSEIRGAWGQRDFRDIEAGVSHALQHFPLDATRMAIAGGSYGGYMAAWAIGHTDRYQAAVVMRSVINAYSMHGTSDFGFANLFQLEKYPWQDPSLYLNMSPISFVDQMKASVLLIHAEDDLRCPIEQAEQLYVALKKYDVPVEFVRFPEETHELSRSGKPWHRVVRLEKIQSFVLRELTKRPTKEQIKD